MQRKMQAEWRRKLYPETRAPPQWCWKNPEMYWTMVLETKSKFLEIDFGNKLKLIGMGFGKQLYGTLMFDKNNTIRHWFWNNIEITGHWFRKKVNFSNINSDRNGLTSLDVDCGKHQNYLTLILDKKRQKSLDVDSGPPPKGARRQSPNCLKVELACCPPECACSEPSVEPVQDFVPQMALSERSVEQTQDLVPLVAVSQRVVEQTQDRARAMAQASGEVNWRSV